MTFIIENFGRELSKNEKTTLEAINKYRGLGFIPDELYLRIIEYLQERQLH